MGKLAPWLRRAAVAGAAWALCIDVSCTIDPMNGGNLDQPISGPSRRLDEACRAGGCVTEGSATVVSGLTSDSVALRVGPGPGSVRLALDSAGDVPPGYEWHVELLMSGAGSVTASRSSCPDPPDVKGPGGAQQVKAQATEPPPVETSITPPTDYGWVTVGPECPRSDASQPISLTVTGNDGSAIDIVDVRIVATPSFGEYGCSMAPRRARRLYF